MIADPNFLASGLAIIATGIVTYLITRFGKAADARGLAEAALVGIGPIIIEGQNKRISELTNQVDMLWTRDSECREKLAAAAARILVLEQKTAAF